jgi:hypothetical protein
MDETEIEALRGGMMVSARLDGTWADFQLLETLAYKLSLPISCDPGVRFQDNACRAFDGGGFAVIIETTG